ncbi:unnamed protein product [Rhizoctonia solani]|uniref:Uncharacterized protein n=1 Tax=Rhizoctonia solani TaxID=456999 RepID=A0A8H3DNT1_9AGAM|nr:unnamed protein product [Rhizoctonia solani]
MDFVIICLPTTCSGVAVDRALHVVTEWPGQDMKQAKIPTAIWYDTNGEAVSFGAETTAPEIEEQAEDSNWFLAEHFKLLLHPDELNTRGNLKVESGYCSLLENPFCYGVTLEQVYSDFLRYLLKHTEKFFKDRIIDGPALWLRHRSKMEFIIAHPNAWGTREQAFLRNMAVRAGFVDATQAQNKIRFLSEGEASVHFCLDADPSLRSHLKPGAVFAVCDAGGSTVDTTVYRVASLTPSLKIEEKRASGCVPAGGIYVDQEAKNYMQTTLSRAVASEDDVAEYVKVGKRDFEASVKRMFSNEVKDYFIKVGERRVSFPSASVRRGHMVLPNTIVKRFFDDCIKQIFEDVDRQVQGMGASLILLVGGFGESPHLRKEFKRRYEGSACQVNLIESPTAKAVANGAIIWSYSHMVTSRSPRSTFGTTCSVPRNSRDYHHQGRAFYIGLDGHEWVSGKWDTIVTKDVPLQVTSVNRKAYIRKYTTPAPDLGNFEKDIEAYVGETPPYWSKNDGIYQPGFRTECKVTADLQNLAGALEKKWGMGGSVFWELRFNVCIRFGGVELEAYLEWEEEKGITRQGEATILPDQPVRG